MGKAPSECADFIFVDPDQITARGWGGAVVMIITALMSGNGYPGLAGTPAELARVVNYNIKTLSHTAPSRQRLHRQASEPGVWQFYYCSHCGARLEVQRCSGCRRRFKRLADSEVPRRQPTLPRTVAVYAVERLGHRFERRRI